MHDAGVPGTEHSARAGNRPRLRRPGVLADLSGIRELRPRGTAFGYAEAMTWTRRVGALLLLSGLAVAPALAWRARIVTAGAGGATMADTRISAANGRTGIGVELEVMSLTIELAWFESVPVTPGRRLVFSWLASPPPAE